MKFERKIMENLRNTITLYMLQLFLTKNYLGRVINNEWKDYRFWSNTFVFDCWI